jgi:HK97 family phage portal protein
MASLLQRVKHIIANRDLPAVPAKKSISSKSSAQMMSAYMQTPGMPVWMPREYSKFADEAYGKNVIAHRCISMIAQGVASATWLLYRTHKASGAKVEVMQHPLLDLLHLPNPSCAGVEFLESLVAYKMISGNSYVQAIALPGEMPRELHLLRPDRIQVIAGKHGIPSGYRYTMGETVREFAVNRLTGQCAILQLKNFHPLNDWYGLSAIDAAAYSIDQHNQAGMWNQALLQNGARPSGALVVKGEGGASSNLSDDQYNRLKNQLDVGYSGSINAGRPLLLEGGLEWKEMSLSPKDMDFIEGKNSAARDIALAFGVPPQLLGIPGDNTYNNMREARLALWEETILPLLNYVTDALNRWLVPMFGSDLTLGYDADAISALSLRRETVWTRLENAKFMTVNEKRAAVGMGPIEGGDVL